MNLDAVRACRVQSPWSHQELLGPSAPPPQTVAPSPCQDATQADRVERSTQVEALANAGAATASEPTLTLAHRLALVGATALSLVGQGLAMPGHVAAQPLYSQTQVVHSLPGGYLQTSNLAADSARHTPGTSQTSTPTTGNVSQPVFDTPSLRVQPGDIFRPVPLPLPIPTNASPVVSPGTAQTSSIDATRQRLQAIQVPKLDPFVFSVVSEADQTQLATPNSETVKVFESQAYGRSVKVSINLDKGPGAPMLVIIPGAFGSRSGNTVHMLESMAQARGMNFVALDNPLCPDEQGREPKHYPGNPELESQVIFDICRNLKTQYPGYFDKVSVTGYSYGGLLSLGVLNAQTEYLLSHPGEQPLINRSVAAISPPERLTDSMNSLDTLHSQVTHEHSGSALFAALHYRHYVRTHDYAHLDPAAIPYTDDKATERWLVDDDGFRSPFQDMVEQVDQSMGINKLPHNHWVAEGRPGQGFDSDPDSELQWEQTKVLRGMTYNDYLNQYVSRDPWYAEHHTTASDVVSNYRYSNLLESARATGIPVLTITSADDFILKPDNVAAFRRAETNQAPNEATIVLPHGGHCGMYYIPEIRETVADFLSAPPSVATSTTPTTPVGNKLP